MSTTLTNGLKLPDKGSVDWYADMQNNYAILDGAVGTVAEHTSQITGKAPLVHTHTKSDITDFPAYGTTAGTICEGNDSRLSDARTPVAHTHTKSDVTDLFNSANTWTSLNTYNGMFLLKSSSDVAEQFKQKLPKDVSVSTDALVRFNTLTDSEDHNVIVEALGHWANYVSKSVTLKYKNDPTKQGVIDFRLESSGSGLFYPQSPFECSLGNSSNQWKSVYAQTYYYNGTAWGLDKANEWTQNQTIKNNSASCTLKNPTITKGVIPANNRNITFAAQDANGEEIGRVLTRVTPNGETITWLAAHNLYKNGALDPTGTDTWASFICSVSPDNTVHIETNCNLYPSNGVTNASLGTSTNKWKTLNGVNPGALSFPSDGTTENTDWFNVAGSILPTGSNATDLTGGPNFFTPSKDGWLCLVVKNCSYISVWDNSNKMGQSLYAPDTTKNQQIILPVLANHSLEIRVIGSSWYSARLIMPKGNV